jgi:hypothetical protein
MKHKTKTISKKLTAECLACGDDVYMGRDPKIGSYVICHGCDAEFQIIDLKPIMIDWPDDDDYYDEEEGYYDDIDDDNDF